MPLPLYELGSRPSYDAGIANAGLWYDKFCDQWSEDWKRGLRQEMGRNGKLEWIKGIVKEPTGDPKLIREAAKRRSNLLLSCGGLSLHFRTDGPFVTGLGRNHPVENGFAWHHALGVPYLPGSSVKGVVRSWSKSWRSVGEEDVNRILGPRGSLSPSVGTVIFLDVLPVTAVQLKADVMTPHYAPYYQQGEPPADWHSPIPISFLVVDSGQEFHFGLMPRHAKRKEDLEDCKIVSVWLIEALKNIGAGAKTAVGYGRFEQIVPRSPAIEWLENFAKSNERPLSEIYTGLPKVLVDEWEGITDPELKEKVRGVIKKSYQELGLWDNPYGSIKKAKKIYER